MGEPLFGWNDVPLSVGSVFGYRLWNWNSDSHRLDSPIRSASWAAGEMTSECVYGSEGKVSSERFARRLIDHFTPEGSKIQDWGWSTYSLEIRWTMTVSSADEVLALERAGWSFLHCMGLEEEDGFHWYDLRGWSIIERSKVDEKSAELGARTHHFHPMCECGFYAYFGDIPPKESPYHNPSVAQVLGVIEGYGETVIGTKGFRCEKARIVALVPASEVSLPTPWRNSYNTCVTKEELSMRFPDALVLSDQEKMFEAVRLSTAKEFI